MFCVRVILYYLFFMRFECFMQELKVINFMLINACIQVHYWYYYRKQPRNNSYRITIDDSSSFLPSFSGNPKIINFFCTDKYFTEHNDSWYDSEKQKFLERNITDSLVETKLLHTFAIKLGYIYDSKLSISNLEEAHMCDVVWKIALHIKLRVGFHTRGSK